MSDLHCRLTNDPTESSLEVGSTRIPAVYHPVQALLELIDRKGMHADALLVPGDIANRASREGLSQGWDFALEVGRALGTNIVLPAFGNHDVDSRRTRPDQDAFYNVRNLRPGFPFGDSESAAKYFAEGFCLQNVTTAAQIVALNTVIDHTDEQTAKRGRFDISRIARLSDFLRRQETAPIRVAMMHHHPILHTGPFKADLDVLATGDKLIEVLRANGCCLVVHGHKHLARLSVNDGLPIFACGSFSAVLGVHASSMANMFHMLMLEANGGSQRGRIETWVFHYGTGWGHAHTEHSGFPFSTGFGSKQTAHDIAAVLEQSSANESDTDHFGFEWLARAAPDISYLTPVQLAQLRERLLAKGLQVSEGGDGIIMLHRLSGT